MRDKDSYIGADPRDSRDSDGFETGPTLRVLLFLGVWRLEEHTEQLLSQNPCVIPGIEVCFLRFEEPMVIWFCWGLSLHNLPLRASEIVKYVLFDRSGDIIYSMDH